MIVLVCYHQTLRCYSSPFAAIIRYSTITEPLVSTRFTVTVKVRPYKILYVQIGTMNLQILVHHASTNIS